MADRGKVIRGIECCMRENNTNMCGDCPYHDSSETRFGCMRSAMRDALALLKEQEARVMKPEEIPDYDGAIYLEDFDKPEIIVGLYRRHIGNHVDLTVRERKACIPKFSEYNKRWRAWTSRPTYEQRKNTPWEPPKEDRA